MSESREVVWKPGDPCPACGNEHNEFRIEGPSDGPVAICPPSAADRTAADMARLVLPGLMEAAKLEPDSRTIADRVAAAERDEARGRVIVTPLSEVGR